MFGSAGRPVDADGAIPWGIACGDMGAAKPLRPPHARSLPALGPFGAGSWAAWGLGCASCAVSCDWGSGHGLDAERWMPTLRALICQVSRG